MKAGTEISAETTGGDATHRKGDALSGPLTVVRSVNSPRWPLQPLLDVARATTASLALELGVPIANIAQAMRRGLSDVQADEWAIRLGFHPVLVWGREWIDSCDEAVSTRSLIADDLRCRIVTGDLPTGEPLPTVKVLADQWQVATRTVTEAIDELRCEGLVSDPGRGRRPIVAARCEGDSA